MSAILITGGRVIDPVTGLDALRDVRLRDGIVTEIGTSLVPSDGEQVLDASGAVVAPGFIDMHVHLREPGYPEKETLATGTRAAVRGGFTSVACMPNTKPALDEPNVLGELQKKAAEVGACRVYPIAAITRARRGEQLVDFESLARAGAVGFSDDGDTVESAALLREGAQRARELSAPFISHCDPEDAIVERDLEIARETGKAWHIAHVSTRGAVELIRRARSAGVRATCEVTPHHLVFTSASAAALGPAIKVHPPLRHDDDVAALREAVLEGTIDAFASDHAPHTIEEKRSGIAPGFSGLEIAVGAYAAALPGLGLARFIELIACNPASILGLRGGSLGLGEPADVTIFADRSWVVDPSNFASKGRVTPFAGRRLPRMVLATIVGGRICYRAPELVA